MNSKDKSITDKNNGGKKFKIAYTFVIADLFHYGILQLLEKADEVSDKLICGVVTDEAVEIIRKDKPISRFDERKSVIEAIKFVDEVIPQNSQDPTENLNFIHNKYPKAELIFVYGENFQEVPGGSYLSSINATLIKQNFYQNLSNEKIAFKTIRSRIPDSGILDTFTPQFITKNVDTFKTDKPSIIVTTKAQTLKTLYSLLKKSRIEKMYIFTVNDWLHYKSRILTDIQKKFNNRYVIVRSSCISEDSLKESKAGYFHSELNVNPNDIKNLSQAIDEVINTYDDTPENNDLNQILIQKQTENILLSGVLITSELKTNSPYYIINYNDESKNTETVTSGQKSKLLRIFKSTDLKILNSPWKKLISAIREIEEIIPNYPLDIEFAITDTKEIIIFQVRPLAANIDSQECNVELIEKQIISAEDQYSKLCKEAKYLNKNGLILSDMLFWNPAEIIGHTPSNLAYSLYDRIIMRKAWNIGLVPLGYPNLFPNNLMVRILYKPYVNVNLAFRVLTPDIIPKNMYEKLQGYYIEMLKSDNSLHDKAEFEIVFSCYDFNLETRLSTLLESGFTNKEIDSLRISLVSFTNKILRDYNNYYQDCCKLINELDAYNQIPLNTRKVLLAKEKNAYIIKDLVDTCQKLGTIPFATIARLAFIAKAMILSLQSAGVINRDELDIIMNSFNTVATELAQDTNNLTDGKITVDTFNKKYGHLRLGTYDIEKRRYDSLQKFPIPTHKMIIKQTVVTEDIKEKINSFLSSSDLEVDFDRLYNFASIFISSREYFKFVFTRTLSDALELIKEAGKIAGIPQNDLSLLEIKDVFAIFDSNSEVIKEKIITKKKECELFDSIILPPIIFGSNDFYIIQSLESQPNFVTSKTVEGNVFILKGNSKQEKSLDGKIIFIENADPGFHWIFSRNIKGLVTKYGGAASHMAICCAEFNVPAAIGCGELYDRMKMRERIILDCSKRVIQ